jgi:hypothetical protein
MRAARSTVLLLALLTTSFARAYDGDLDPSFGFAGVAYAGIADASAYSGMTVQPDGKVLACGTHATGNQRDFIVVRFLADGSLDPGFGMADETEVPRLVDQSLDPVPAKVAQAKPDLERAEPAGLLEAELGE